MRAAPFAGPATTRIQLLSEPPAGKRPLPPGGRVPSLRSSGRPADHQSRRVAELHLLCAAGLYHCQSMERLVQLQEIHIPRIHTRNSLLGISSDARLSDDEAGREGRQGCPHQLRALQIDWWFSSQRRSCSGGEARPLGRERRVEGETRGAAAGARLPEAPEDTAHNRHQFRLAHLSAPPTAAVRSLLAERSSPKQRDSTVTVASAATHGLPARAARPTGARKPDPSASRECYVTGSRARRHSCAASGPRTNGTADTSRSPPPSTPGRPSAGEIPSRAGA